MTINSGYIIFVVGTRAQLIKVAPVMRALKRISASYDLILTGQHKDTMSDLLLEFEIDVQPALLGNNSERSTILSLTLWAPAVLFRLINKLKKYVKSAVGGKVLVVVHGDTLSTLIGVLAAKSAGADVVHVESGLSSGSLIDPFPEEIVRRIVFRFTDVAFCPNRNAVRYMIERYQCVAIDSQGNTIIDAVDMARQFGNGAEKSGRPYIVVSLHRFQNIYSQQRLKLLVSVVCRLSELLKVYFVLHPATEKRLKTYGLLRELAGFDNLHLVPRMGYRDFIGLAVNADLLLTDGGSNQEECAILGLPVIIMRKRTERDDGLGRNIVLEESIKQDMREYIRSEHYKKLRYDPQSVKTSPSAIIAEELKLISSRDS